MVLLPHLALKFMNTKKAMSRWNFLSFLHLINHQSISMIYEIIGWIYLCFSCWMETKKLLWKQFIVTAQLFQWLRNTSFLWGECKQCIKQVIFILVFIEKITSWIVLSRKLPQRKSAMICKCKNHQWITALNRDCLYLFVKILSLPKRKSQQTCHGPWNAKNSLSFSVASEKRSYLYDIDKWKVFDSFFCHSHIICVFWFHFVM